MRLSAVAALVAALLPGGSALANGRFPATVSVRFHPTDSDFLLVPATFGLLVSKDGGASFQWVCEAAIGYTGTYDPDYLITENGDIFATTFNGLQVSRDGACSFEPVGAPLGNGVFINQIERGPDGRIWASTSTGGEVNDVYVSADGEEPFLGTGLASDNAWWLSVATTPDDVDRIYVSGYQPMPQQMMIRRKTTPEGDWEEMPVDDIAFGEANPFFYIVGVSPTDAEVVFGRAVGVNAPIGDALYRSENGGTSWTKVLDFPQTMSGFVIRSDGQTVIAGSVRPCIDEPPSSEKGCVMISHDAGVTWEAAEAQPQMQCIGERPDGVLFACGFNFAPDFFAVGTSEDGESWESIFRFVDFEESPADNAPLVCPADTLQATECAATLWPTTACYDLQLDLPMCPSGDGGASANDAGEGGDGGGGGCCRASGAAATGQAVPAVLVVLGLMLRRRKRPRSR